MASTAIAVYKEETLERFKSIDPSVVCVGLRQEPRRVSSRYRFEKVTSAGFLDAISSIGVVIDPSKADELVAQAKALRKKHFWFVWKMYAPSREVINSTVSVIRFCPADMFLEGYYVANYGNGTVALMRRSKNYSISINIGKHAVSYAKLRLSDYKIVNSGRCEIEKKAIENLFETL